MNEVVLTFSKSPKKESNYSSFDVVLYNQRYYAGFNLFKDFNNYLAGTAHLSAIKFDDITEAKKYFDAIEF